jgi:hypothetical protein
MSLYAKHGAKSIFSTENMMAMQRNASQSFKDSNLDMHQRSLGPKIFQRDTSKRESKALLYLVMVSPRNLPAHVLRLHELLARELYRDSSAPLLRACAQSEVGKLKRPHVAIAAVFLDLHSE